MKRKKKFLSVICGVLIIVGVIPMMQMVHDFDLSGFITTANAIANIQNIERTDSYVSQAFSEVDNYLASYDNLADSFDYYSYVGSIITNSPVVDLIYLGIENDTIAESYVSDLMDNEAFLTAYAVWKMSGYISDPVEAIYDGTGITSLAYYEAVLLKCLECEFTSDNFIDILNKDCVKNSTSFLKAFYSSCETFSMESYAESIQTPISELMENDKLTYDYLCEYASEWVESNIKNKLGFFDQSDMVKKISDLLKASSNIEKFVEKIASIKTLSNLSDTMGAYMSSLSTVAGDNELGAACDEMAAIILDAAGITLTVDLFDGVTSIGKQFFSKAVSKVWKDGVLQTISNGALSNGTRLINGALLAITIGRTIGDVFFSTNKICDKYETLKSFANVLNLQRSVLSSLISSYSGAYDEAVMLADATDLLYQSYSVGADLTQSALDVYKDAIFSFTTEDEYNIAKDGVAAEKNYYKNQYALITKAYKISAVNDSVSWLLLHNGTLLIIGKGNVSSAPWKSRANEIKHIYISSTITSLSDNLFSGTALSNETVILESVTSFAGNTFTGINSNCSIVFNSNVTCTGSLSADYPIYAEKRINLGDTDINSIYVKGDLFAENLKVRSEAIIGGIAEFSQWGVVTIPADARLVCNILSGRTWAYAVGYYNTKINNSGAITASSEAYGYIDYNGSENATFSTSRLVGAQLRMQGGIVYVAGETNLISSEQTRVVINGESGDVYSLSGTLKSLDIYSPHATITNILTIKDYIDFHGCDITVSKYIDLPDGAKAIEGSNYRSLRLIDHYYVHNNICADSICIERNIYVSSGDYKLTGTVNGNIKSLSYGISISSGAQLTIDGDLYGTKNFVYCSDIYNSGTLTVTGKTSGYINFKNSNGKYHLNEVDLIESSTEGGIYYITGNVAKMEISNNSSYDFCGSEVQTLTLNGNLGKCEINNSKGVIFTNRVNSTVLFNHNLNPFTLQNGGAFIDYDKDGLKDNVDPLPLVAKPFDMDVLDALSIKVCLHSGDSFDQYYWEVIDTSEGYTDIVIPPVIDDIPVKVIDDIFLNHDDLDSVTFYPGLYDISHLRIDNESVLIRGYSGSPAQKYAESTGHRFESIGNVNSISINTAANKLDYTIIDDFCSDGLLLNVCTDDEKSYITNDFETTGYDKSPGIKTITVSYAEATDTYSVIVSEYSYSYLTDQDIDINNYYGTDRDLVIPNDLYGRKVKQISSLGSLENVKTIFLPDSLNSIASTVFNGATELKAIYVDDDNRSFVSKEGILFSANGEKVIRCPISIDNKNIFLDETVTEIESYSFANCDLQSIILPNSVHTISSYAFSGNSFTTLTIPESVTTLQRNSFENCRQLQTVNYNAIYAETGITASGFLAPFLIPSSAVFRNDSNVRIVNIGSKVNHISTGLFVGMSELETVNISEKSELVTISQYAFTNDPSLSDIYYNCYYNDWKQITIDNTNVPLTNATLHCLECDECTWDVGIIRTIATCVATGEKLLTCKVCGKERSETIAIDPGNHVGVTSVINQRDATCVQEGYSGDTVCSNCKTTIQKGTVVSKKEHTWNDGTITVAATCKEEGIKTFSCTVCGTTKTEVVEINPTNHVGYGTETRGYVAAQCETEGYTGDTYCLGCGTKIGNGAVIEPLGHDFDTEWTVDLEPTCTAVGSKSHHCTRCDEKSHVTEIDKLDHTWNEGAITKEPTATEPGVKIYTCIYCGETMTEEIPKLDEEIQAGDINGDGKVNNKDLTRLMKYLAGEDVSVEASALDVNGDGQVNNKDLTRLMKYLSGEDVEIFIS